jgi:cobalt-zinc-cadmium efflux system outer membrane protein
MPNPALSGDLERTTQDDDRNVVTTVRLAQPLDIWGARSARRETASLRRQAAEATLVSVEADLDVDVVGAWTSAVAATQRAMLAGRVLAAFDTALRVSAERLGAGDVSPYSHRRLQLEAARYAAWQTEARLQADAARRTLAVLVDSAPAPSFFLPDSLRVSPLSLDTARFASAESRPAVRAAALTAAGTEQAATAVARERIPVPTIVGGYKAEQMPGDPDAWTGFVAGLSFPVPLWDRRGAARDAAVATGEASRWQADATRRGAERDLAVALMEVLAVEAQSEQLGRRLGPEARRALEALQVAWQEGEISLIEWLDGIRAWHEAFDAYTTLQAERIVRRANLARAAGLPVAELLTEVP